MSLRYSLYNDDDAEEMTTSEEMDYMLGYLSSEDTSESDSSEEEDQDRLDYFDIPKSAPIEIDQKRLAEYNKLMKQFVANPRKEIPKNPLL